jgi:hypothetical protein
VSRVRILRCIWLIAPRIERGESSEMRAWARVRGGGGGDAVVVLEETVDAAGDAGAEAEMSMLERAGVAGRKEYD